METDKELLESYARSDSERAFRELVNRHINLIYSAALRESNGNTGTAEDITQAVFTELARSAKKLVGHPAIAGWLYTSVRRTAANIRRADHRRQRREHEAFMMNELLGSEATDDLWRQVRPVIDDAMHELEEGDRAVVVLRFFEGKSFREVGDAFGISENAARMRCERSLERLRDLLSRRGVTSTAATLAAVLACSAAMSAPAALASTIASTALSNASIATAMTFASARALTQLAAGALLLGVVGLVRSQVHSSRTQSLTKAALSVSESGSPAAAQRSLTNAAAPAPTLEGASASPTILRVVDAQTGAPLPGAKVHMPYFRHAGRSQILKRTTDPDGKVPLDPIPPPFEGANLFVTADGHVPKVICWGYGRSMPAEYTMKLEPGDTAGGVVVDEAGRPIANAQIEVNGPGDDAALQENIQFGPDATLVTDGEGRWSCNMIPKNAERLSLVVTHPEYAEATIPINSDAGQTNVIVMKSGFAIAGTVQDWNGNLVVGASIRDVRMNEEGERSGKTDASGAFQLKGLKGGSDVVLTVQAQGFAPQARTLQVTSTVSGLQFQLRPGQLLRGRVIDDEGRPIPNAWAETTAGRRKISWSITTDVEGRFAWDSAPEEPVLYSFRAQGFNQVYALPLQADGSEHEIKLTREKPGDKIQISGTAIDADSGQPLNAFKVMFGEIEGDHNFPLQFWVDGRNGNFNFLLATNSPRPTFLIQIERDGYVPANSKILSTADGNQALAFKLQKGSGPSGVVLLPNGEPAANATVLLCTPDGGVSLKGPVRIEGGWNSTKYRAQTDRIGRFTLPAATEPHAVVAVHDQGYAEASPAAVKASGSIVLQPWGRMEGRVMLDSKPLTEERVVAANGVYRYSDSGQRFALTSFYFETKTDSAGNFYFEKVPPGRCAVFRQMLFSRIGFESHDTFVTVNPGEVTKVMLGGEGRTVIGQAVARGVRRPIDWQRVPVQLRLKTGNEPGPRPKRGDFPTREAFVQAAEHFFGTSRAERRFGAMCERDGRFRVPDIPAGEYKLEITARGFNPDSVAPDVDSGFLPEIASFIGQITVPESADGGSGGPLDLGTVVLKSPINH